MEINLTSEEIKTIEDNMKAIGNYSSIAEYMKFLSLLKPEFHIDCIKDEAGINYPTVYYIKLIYKTVVPQFIQKITP